jgi:hypothetical protein
MKQYEQGDSAVVNLKAIGRPHMQWLCLFCGLPIQKIVNSAETYCNLYSKNARPKPGFREWKRKFLASVL